ncbi:MAG: hypothetical protein PHE21_02290 [Candidatus Dojkabacteria bacterium]|nr:hypothetical protein [Candidatus Dojkabacteria bacterium]
MRKRLERKHIDLQFISLFISIIAFLILGIFSGEIIWLEDSQYIISLISGVLAIFIGVLAILRYFMQKGNMRFIFLGAGFLGTGVLDIIQAVTETQGTEPTLMSVIPKVFLSILLLLGWFVGKRSVKDAKRKKEEVKLMILISAIFLVFVGVYLFILFRGAVVGNLAIVILGLVSFLLLILSLLGYVFDKEWRYDDFYYWIIFAISLLIMSNIFYLPILDLEYSNMINLSVLARLFGYVGLLVAFLNSIYVLYIKEKDIQKELGDENRILSKTKAKVEEEYVKLRKEKWCIMKKK